jgi:hypothetical protein
MAVQRERERLRKIEEESNLRTKQASLLQRLIAQDGMIDYSNMDYFDAVLVYAIMLVSDDACEMGKFGDAYRLHLCPSDGMSQRLLARLFNKGILLFAAGTPFTAIEIGDDDQKWSYDPYKITWRFARDANGLTFTQVFTDLGRLIDLRDSHSSYQQCVADLWWNLGFDDALQFLRQEVTTYRIGDYPIGPKTEAALRHALEKYSIPQVRRAIRYVGEKAVVANARGFNRRHALNTIPGNLINHVDRAQSENWTVYPLFSDWDTSEPRLINVLFNRVIGAGVVGFKATTGAMLGSASVQL